MDSIKLMNSIPELPEDFEMWVRNVPLWYSKYMFTFRENEKRRGFCSHCEQIVNLDYRDKRNFDCQEIENCTRKHNEKGYCPSCHSPVTFKDNGRGKGKLWDFNKAIALQRVDNVACFRFFDVMRNYSDCNLTPVRTQITEEYRLFLDPTTHKAEMYKRDVAYGCKWSWLYYGGNRVGEVESVSDWYKLTKVNTNLTRYGSARFYNLDAITELFSDTDFKYCQLDAYENATKKTYGYKNYVAFVTLFCRYPKAVEYLMKTGFQELIASYIGNSIGLNMRAKSPEKLFGLTKPHIRYFKKNKNRMTCENLCFLQELEAAGLSENDLKYFYETSNSYSFKSSWESILKYTTRVKAENYLNKQKEKHAFYSDYIKDCEELGYNLAEHAVLFPRDLRLEHMRTIELIRANADALQKIRNKQERAEAAKRNAALSKDIQKQFTELCQKYEFHSGGMFIRPAKNLKEIKDEGKLQHICVGSDNMHYIKNHASGIAFILFLRSEEEPDKPFYTVEITNAGTVVQCRGYANRGQTDEVKAFIEVFKESIKKRSVKKSA